MLNIINKYNNNDIVRLRGLYKLERILRTGNGLGNGCGAGSGLAISKNGMGRYTANNIFYISGKYIADIKFGHNGDGRGHGCYYERGREDLGPIEIAMKRAHD